MLSQKCKYLSLVDVDDYVSADSYVKVLDVTKKYNTDCVDFNRNFLEENTKTGAFCNGIEKNIQKIHTILHATARK